MEKKHLDFLYEELTLDKVIDSMREYTVERSKKEAIDWVASRTVEEQLSENLLSVIDVCPYCRRKHDRSKAILKKADTELFHESFTFLMNLFESFSKIPAKDWVTKTLGYNKSRCALGHYNDAVSGKSYTWTENSDHPIQQALSAVTSATNRSDMYVELWQINDTKEMGWRARENFWKSEHIDHRLGPNSIKGAVIGYLDYLLEEVCPYNSKNNTKATNLKQTNK